MILDPGLALLLRATGLASDDRARVLLLAIAGQESGWEARRQTPGPARGFWQFEQSGGVRGVLKHPASAPRIAKVCAVLSIPTDEATVYEAIAWSDHIAGAMARLLLWTDPAPLPIADSDAGWRYYDANWRPGHPRPDDWAGNYQAALAAIKQE